jgi:hypothetical protein
LPVNGTVSFDRPATNRPLVLFYFSYFYLVFINDVFDFIIIVEFQLIGTTLLYSGSRVSSGSIVSDCGLDDRAIRVRSPAGAEDFSSNLCVQTGSGVHRASCTMGTGGPFPGGKARPGRDAVHSPPSSAEVLNEYELYLLSPQAPPWR